MREEELKEPPLHAEAVNDEAKLIMHRMIARSMPSDPDLISRAWRKYEACTAEHLLYDHIRYWVELLGKGPEEVRRQIVARDEFSYWMRLSSPLGLVSKVKFTDIPFRRRIWRDAKRILMMQKQARGDDWDGFFYKEHTIKQSNDGLVIRRTFDPIVRSETEPMNP